VTGVRRGLAGVARTAVVSSYGRIRRKSWRRKRKRKRRRRRRRRKRRRRRGRMKKRRKKTAIEQLCKRKRGKLLGMRRVIMCRVIVAGNVVQPMAVLVRDAIAAS